MIVKEGLIVGAMILNDNGYEVSSLIKKCVCIDYSCDNNGAGYKTRCTYTYFICEN